MGAPEKTFACMTLLFMRQDKDRADGMAYWRGPHAQLVARAPGRREYRQHHFDVDGGGWWPAPSSVDTAPSADRRVDGIPEVTFASPVAALRGRAIAKLIHTDEANVFRRTLMYITAPGGAHWWRSSPETKSRAIVLLRRSPQTSAKTFSSFLDQLAERLAAQQDLSELRALTFRPWREGMWDTPDVDHTNPENEQFDGALVLGGLSIEVIRAAASAAVAGMDQAQAENLAAAHAYNVGLTLVYRHDDRPTLPQTAETPESLIRRPGLDPVRRTFSPIPARSHESRSVADFPEFATLKLPGDGAEDVILDADEYLVTGLSGGKVVRIDPDSGKASVAADTKGRPLGLELMPDGRLLVCDAHRGLLRVDPATGAVETLVEHVRGVPLRFCSNAAVEKDGTIWFTESTSRFDFEHYLGSFLEHRPSGRVFRRDVSGDVEVIVDNLYFANGITLVPDGSALLVAETSAARISRLPVSGSDAGNVEVVAELPGYPDNLSAFNGGRTWVGMTTPRVPALEKLGQAPKVVAKVAWAMPQKPGPGTTWVMAIDESGAVVADLQTADAPITTVTGAVERRGELFCVSTEADSLLRFVAP